MAATGVALMVIAGLAACERPPDEPVPGEEVLTEMEPGYGKQAVLNSLPEGPDVDQASNMQNGYRLDRYFTGGRSVEVLWLRPDSQTPLTELERSDMNPVIFADNVLDGWGWDHFDGRQSEWGLTDRSVAEVGEVPPGS